MSTGPGRRGKIWRHGQRGERPRGRRAEGCGAGAALPTRHASVRRLRGPWLTHREGLSVQARGAAAG